MFRITSGTDMGWPYTYYDGVRKMRFDAPEYGGDGKTAVTDSKYATPVAAFAPQRPAVLDLTFYNGSQIPQPLSRRRVPGHAWRRRRRRGAAERPWRV